MSKNLAVLLSAFPSEYIVISLADLLPPSVALRSHDEDAINIEELAEDLALNGLDVPPVVLVNGDGKYTLNDGSRRMTAAMLLGNTGRTIVGLEEDEIRVRTIGNLDEWDEETQLANQIRLNAHMLETNPKEYFTACLILAEKGWTLQRIAESIKKKPEVVGSWLRAFNVPAEIKEQIIEGKISLGNGKVLADNKKFFDNDVLADLAEESKEMTVEDFKEFMTNKVNEVKELAKTGASKETSVKVFELTPIYPSKKSLADRYEMAVLAHDENPSSETEAELTVIQTILQLTPLDESKRRAQFEKDLADAKTKSEKAKQDKMFKKLGTDSASYILEHGQEAFDEMIAQAKANQAKADAESEDEAEESEEN